MNFFEARVSITDGQAELRGDGLALMLSGEKGRALGPYRDRKLMLGIRPEHLAIGRGDQSDARAELTARTEVVEVLGSEQHLYLLTGDTSFVARVDAGASVRVGDSVKLSCAKEHLQLFDPQTERNLFGLSEANAAI